MTTNETRPLARRSFLKATTAGVTASALAGCRSRDSGSGLGDTLKIGVLAPGPDGTFEPGTAMANAAQLAVDDLNEDGGVLDADVEVVVEDTEQSTSTATSAYRNLVGSESVDVTVGVFTSEVMMSLMDLIAEQGTIHMTTGAATPESSQLVSEDYESYKYYFRPGPLNSPQLGQALTDFAGATFGDLGWNQVSLIAESYEWNQPVMDRLRSQLPEIGVEIVNETRYATGTTNFGPVYDDVENAGADAAVVAMAHPGGSVPAIVQWARGRRQFEFGGIHIPSQLPSFYQSSQGAASYTVSLNIATPQSELTDQTQPFISAYQDQFDSAPAYTGYITFDAIKQYAQVVEETGTIAEDDVIAGLEENSYTGTFTTIEYHNKGHEYAHDIIYSSGEELPVFQQWRPSESGDGGTQEVIYPEQFQTAEYQRPPWLQ